MSSYNFLSIFSRFKCFTVNFQFTRGSMLAIKSKQVAKSIKGGGKLIIGQDQRIFNDGYDSHRSFSGEVSRFVLYDIIIDEANLIQFSQCETLTAKSNPIISFDNLEDFELKGNSKAFVFKGSILCDPTKFNIIVFPFKQTFAEVNVLCKALNGLVVLPKTDSENEKLYDTIMQFSNSCSTSLPSISWLGAAGSEETKRWVSFENKVPLTYSNFAHFNNKVIDDRNCAVIAGPRQKYKWFSSECDYPLTCGICYFKIDPIVKIRGLCKHSIIDRTYTIQGYKEGFPILIGESYTVISKTNNSWAMTSKIDNAFKGRLISNDSIDFPLGLNKWKIEGDRCDSEVCTKKVYNRSIEYKFLYQRFMVLMQILLFHILIRTLNFLES